MEAKQFIDLVQPKHDRTSCDDSIVANGFGSRHVTVTHTKKDADGEWKREEQLSYYRCSRCAMLDILSGETLDERMIAYIESSRDVAVMAMIRFVKNPIKVVTETR